MAEVRLGTSGWSYEDWVGAFYPSKEVKKLPYYSKVFNTAEIDSTFYSYPSKGLVFGWARSSPRNFRFSAKLPRLITHEKKLDLKKGVEDDVLRFIELMDPLIERGKLGILLIQLPPGFEKDYRRLEEFFKILPDHLKFAVEFRHRSWWTGDTWRLLGRYHIANTVVDEPLLPPDPIATADFSFIRWHGRGRRPWYNYQYRVEELKPWIPRVEQISEKVKEVYGYFNNHFHGYAVQNSLQMMELLKLITPEQLKAKKAVDEYRKERVVVQTKAALLKLMPNMRASGLDELLMELIGKERLIRATRIKDEEVSDLKITPHSIQAKVREYNVLIDVDGKVILHDCPDWARCIPEKRFCKHVGKVFLLLSTEEAVGLLKKILQGKDEWEFRPYQRLS